MASERCRPGRSTCSATAGSGWAARNCGSLSRRLSIRRDSCSCCGLVSLVTVMGSLKSTGSSQGSLKSRLPKLTIYSAMAFLTISVPLFGR
ncbi:Uncharacterised protein [Mycobacteroides abscessus subsp. abscessus]|nr:Uncharacterised protein [Mycobacteroides abscessus subsp. abscessus]